MGTVVDVLLVEVDVEEEVVVGIVEVDVEEEVVVGIVGRRGGGGGGRDASSDVEEEVVVDPPAKLIGASCWPNTLLRAAWTRHGLAAASTAQFTFVLSDETYVLVTVTGTGPKLPDEFVVNDPIALHSSAPRPGLNLHSEMVPGWLAANPFPLTLTFALLGKVRTGGDCHRRECGLLHVDEHQSRDDDKGHPDAEPARNCFHPSPPLHAECGDRSSGSVVIAHPASDKSAHGTRPDFADQRLTDGVA